MKEGETPQMIKQTPLELRLEVSVNDSTTDELDWTTRQLLAELRDTNVESAELAGDETAPRGTKAVDPVTLGAIAIVVLPTVLPKVIELVQAWMLRGQGRVVKFKGKIAGQNITFEGQPEDLQKLISTLSAEKKH